MRKKIAGLMVCVMMVGILMFGCGKTEEQKAAMEMPIERAEDILIKVWACYEEENKFTIIGGDMDTMVVGYPAEFNMVAEDEMEGLLGVTSEAAELLDNVASMTDEMNSNDFTVGAFQVIEASDVKTLRESIETALTEKDWSGEQPEKLVVATLEDDYLIVGYGTVKKVDVFMKVLQDATDAKIVKNAEWKK